VEHLSDARILPGLAIIGSTVTGAEKVVENWMKKHAKMP